MGYNKNDGLERLLDTLTYIRQFVDAGLALHILDQIVGQNYETIGEELSLSGFNYWILGTEGQHRAVRALLLCQRVYLAEKYSSVIPPGSTITKKACLRMSEDQVKRAIRTYLPDQNARKSDLVRVALKHHDGEVGLKKICWETFDRESGFVKQNVCYSVIPWWLFMAGFLSIRWLTKENSFSAYTVNKKLGRGVLIPAGQDHTIPEGNLINFHEAGHEENCHWAVSMGQGWAVGVNNTPGWAVPTEKTTIHTKFRNNGGGVYGEFEISSMRAVLAEKYAKTTNIGTAGSPKMKVTKSGCEVRSIDPTAVAGFL